MIEYKYFKPEEFENCSPPCKITDMRSDFMEKLDKARYLAGIPFHVNSAYRSVQYEKDIRHRTGTSSHCKGLAVDLSCLTSRARLRMVTALLDAGFCRLGIYPTFIHVDMDSDKTPAIWYGRK